MKSSSPFNLKPQTRLLRSAGIALVVTLLMLSVITFLAVAFLVMTRRDTSSTNATLDVSVAQAASEAGLARAEAEIIARMTAQTDVLAYDYMVSSNYITPYGYTSEAKGQVDTNNVNYDFRNYNEGGGPFGLSKSTANDWAQNIANLFFDPRPPVFVLTNTDPTKPMSEFRYYVDLNRNGQFEGSSFRSAEALDLATTPSYPMIPNTSGQQGEPEWIGILTDPTHAHSRSNLFIGRFAYLVLPIGKTLDLNYNHNEVQQYLDGGVGLLNNAFKDGFSRDQGVGSWEMNLGGYFRALNTNIYDTQPYVSAANRYDYVPPNADQRSVGLAEGYCFVDAKSIATNRMLGQNAGQSLPGMFGPGYNAFFRTNEIDDFGVLPHTKINESFDFTSQTDPEYLLGLSSQQYGWPGGYYSRHFFDMQDLFNPHMTSVAFTNRLGVAGGSTGWPDAQRNLNRILYDRYTYQRMLATIGTGSEPEFSTYVYTNEIIYNTEPGTNIPKMLRTKMNLNYDNSAQIALGPYSPMPTNPTPWTDRMKFFTNAADLLLRTQDFPYLYTNLLTKALQLDIAHYGIGSIPIYVPTNSAYRYTSQIHRMLQLAANLWDEGHNNDTFAAAKDVNGTNVISRLPSVFRPLCVQSNNTGNVYIVGYELMTSTNFLNQYAQNWKYLTTTNVGGLITTNDNVYGVPWVVGAVKGLPSFNQFDMDTYYVMTRKVQVARRNKRTIPDQTNQLYEFSISNRFGIGAWNSYRTPFSAPGGAGVDINATVQSSIQFGYSNASGVGTRVAYYTNVYINVATNTNVAVWRAWNVANARTRDPYSMLTPLLDNSNFLSSLAPNAPVKYSDLKGLNGLTHGFFDISDLRGPGYDTNIFTVHGWMVNITNYLRFVMTDHATGSVLDFVNIGPFGTTLNITNLLNQNASQPVVGTGTGAGSQTSFSIVWNPTGGNDSPTPPPAGSPISLGELHQIRVGAGYETVSDWPPATAANQATFTAQKQQFQELLLGSQANTNLSMDCPFQPSVLMQVQSVWAANDPLVHYTVEDLTPPGYSNIVKISNPTYQQVTPTPDTLGGLPLRYEPWPSSLPGGQGMMGGNVMFKDPQMTESADWNFPTNLYPSVGWIGRVHRGTPWQTVYLKADANYEQNKLSWIEHWAGDLSPGLNQPGASYPTNDWGLLDLFTTAPNDNALRGTLSINQTNIAAWHALLDGVIVLTNTPTGVVGTPIDPTITYDTNANAVSYIMDSEFGINALRTNHFAGQFHRIGDILQAPALTVASPYVDFDPKANYPATDEMVERIPQQVASLLKVGQPQFVIYAWGQSLRPQSLYNALGGPASLFKLCTNYSITGEFLTRTVCHLDLSKSDRFGTNAHLKVDSFTILPAAQ